MTYSLKIKNLRAGIEHKEILKGVDLMIKPKEVHALMGRDGSGKSTLAQTLMGSPTYKVLEGSAGIFRKDILAMLIESFVYFILVIILDIGKVFCFYLYLSVAPCRKRFR